MKGKNLRDRTSKKRFLKSKKSDKDSCGLKSLELPSVRHTILLDLYERTTVIKRKIGGMIGGFYFPRVTSAETSEIFLRFFFVFACCLTMGPTNVTVVRATIATSLSYTVACVLF